MTDSDVENLIAQVEWPSIDVHDICQFVYNCAGELDKRMNKTTDIPGEPAWDEMIRWLTDYGALLLHMVKNRETNGMVVEDWYGILDDSAEVLSDKLVKSGYEAMSNAVALFEPILDKHMGPG